MHDEQRLPSAHYQAVSPRHALLPWHWRPLLSVEALILLASIFFAVACNGLFWRGVMDPPGSGLRTGVAVLLMLLGVHAFLLGLIVWRWNARIVLSLLVLVTMVTADYMGRFHVYLDASMLRSVLLTETKEAGELITPALFVPVLLVLVPILFIWRVRLRQHSWGRALLWRIAFLVASLLLMLAGVLLAFQDLSAQMRSNRELRYLVTPANYLVGVPRVLAGLKPDEPAVRQPIGTDAQVMARPAGSKPRLLVIVVGETARAQNWGLNGYERQTTPLLAGRDVINFENVQACGTNTEVSLPCMFSPFGRREGYDEDRIRGHQSLLHLLERVGITTLWRDNQTGCKGVCDGLPTQRLDDAQDPVLCTDGRCLDEILLADLAAEIRSRPGDRVIVLHQLGNHGPSYHLRYPPELRRFTPTCDTAEMGQCTREQIVNAYDNALLATDRMLDRTIELLSGMHDYDSAMIYVSDHGESLGEKGLFLHGIPYAIAPAEQLQVPMVMWFSPSFVSSRGIDQACLRQRARAYADHDNLFASILGLMQVSTAIYDEQLDLFAGCVERTGQVSARNQVR